MKLPKIEFIDMLQITKVRDWSIHFRYYGNRYLLHLSEEVYEETTTLYEIIDGKLNAIHSEYGDCIPELYLINEERRTKDCQPYNHIDIIKFVYDMTWNGFLSSKFDYEIKLKKSPIYQKKKEIDRLQKEIELLEKLKGEWLRDGWL